MASQATKSNLNGAKLDSPNSTRSKFETQSDGGVKLKKFREEAHLLPTQKNHLKSRKRTLDVLGSSDSKSITGNSLSDKPSKAKKTKHFKGSLREFPKSQTQINSKKRKPDHLSSRLDNSADTTYQESENEDSKTAILLKGFESSDDEDSSGQKLSAEPTDYLKEVPAIPKLRQTPDDAENKESTKLKDAGVVYVGRIPHGFYEHQMNAYFSQFGEILRLRISRNRKTGHVKHYAFIEFASSEVAKIVAATMDKYLLFGHILQVRLIPSDQVHPDLFKGAGKKFRVIPRNKMEAETLKAGLSREGWQNRIKVEKSRRRKKDMRIKEIMGYSYEAPIITNVTEVPLRIAEGKGVSNGENVSITGMGNVSAKNK